MTGVDNAQHTEMPHYWRMPGEEDPGQAARQTLYNYADDSDIDDLLAGGDDDEQSATGWPVASSSAPVPAAIRAADDYQRKRRTPRAAKLEWDWDVDLADRARESRLDGADKSFQVDRKAMREVVKEKLGADVARIRFISSGTFHKAYLVTLSDSQTVIARVARRFMPRLKTESEVATLAYLRTYTKIPVPEVYAWDSNPYNRLGGEWILMSRAPGIPLRKVYHSMPHQQLVALLHNLAELVIPLFGHRFSHIGSLYFGESKLGSEVNVSDRCMPESVPNRVDSLAGRKRDSGYDRGAEEVKSEDDHLEHVLTPTIESVARSGSVDYAFGSSLPTPTRTPSSSSLGLLTPKPGKTQFSMLSLTPASLSRTHSHDGRRAAPLRARAADPAQAYHIGPIISWPFFGSRRGELSHTSFPPEIDRGPWASTVAYLRACVEREALGVSRENEGRARPHRLHLDPDDVLPHGGRMSKKGEFVWGYGYVRRARLAGYGDGDDEEEEDADAEVSGSETPSDDRDDSDSDSDSGSPTLSINSDSDEDGMYRDYRRYQRSTFLVAELSRREKRVRSDMERWRKCVSALEGVLAEVVARMRNKEGWQKEGVGGAEHGTEENELFGLDCHDLSLDNVFVDEKDPSKITCIIDWESTTTRPLWACAHLPSFLLSSPFSSNLFRRAVAALPRGRFPHAGEWLLLERAGGPLRYAHKCAEWDGWEEGLVGSILGDVEHEPEDDAGTGAGGKHFVGVGTAPLVLAHAEQKEPWEEDGWEEPLVAQMRLSFAPDGTALPRVLAAAVGVGAGVGANPPGAAGDLSPTAHAGVRRASHGSADCEVELEKMLDVRGDLCGGRGGELGRRLEAWLVEGSPEWKERERKK